MSRWVAVVFFYKNEKNKEQNLKLKGGKSVIAAWGGRESANGSTKA